MEGLLTIRLLLTAATLAQGDGGGTTFDLGAAGISLDGRGRVGSVRFAGVPALPPCPQPAFCIKTDSGEKRPASLERKGETLRVAFEGGAAAEFSVLERPGVLVLRLLGLRSPEPVLEFRCFSLAVPRRARLSSTLNAAWIDGRVAAVMAGEVNVQAMRENMEAPENPPGARAVTALAARTIQRYGIEPAVAAVLVCDEKDLEETLQRLEEAAGIPAPRPGGTWNKRSPWVRRSYLFLTDFRQAQIDRALRIARRGGFDMILLGQESWCQSTGHYEINRRNFPDGLDGLRRTVDRFRAAGFKVGLHFLGPSISHPDPYLTPVPDKRLVKDAWTTLAADVDEKADFIPLEKLDGFPLQDGGYDGKGTIVQIDQELVHYTAPAEGGLKGCRRGALGTKASPHRKGARAAHLQRSYGYFLFDMDTSLLDEVTDRFTRVTNALGADMIYFDGAERLQGDHWYYNPRLIRAFHDKLARKDILLQASSYSHYSWHMLGRTASADGHGDIKGYLDERSAWLDSFSRDLLPLDIGWYYGYDPSATPDMYEYVLCATIGYDSSMSFQASVDAAARHPFTGEILDLIARYERLRLSGAVGPEMRARLRIDKALGGKMDPSRREGLLDKRREYRLIETPAGPVFQAVRYGPWREIRALDDVQVKWEIDVPAGPAKAGFTIHAQGGPWLAPGPSFDAPDAVLLESFDDLAPYASAPGGRAGILKLEQGQGGAVSPGVTHRLESVLEDARRDRCAVYTATSSSPHNLGWSYFGRSYPAPVDISRHKAIGFWLRGDGKGGQFKLQLRDEKGAAADHYISNNYVGWRYHQLARPEKDTIDYGRLRHLGIYYNGLPGNATVQCAVDDVKALAAADRRSIADPWMNVGGNHFLWKGSLEEGQYLVYWDDAGAKLYGPGLGDGRRVDLECAPPADLSAGRRAVAFGCAGQPAMSLRARVTLRLPETHRP